MISEPPEVGSTVMLGGDQQDHPLVLMADTECRIVGRAIDADGRLLLRHNCTGTRGDSGAPLLIEKGGEWSTAGVDVAANSALPVGSPSSSTRLAAPLTPGPSHRSQIDITVGCYFLTGGIQWAAATPAEIVAECATRGGRSDKAG